VLWRFCREIEDAGYEAVPIPNNFSWSNASMTGDVKEKIGQPRPEWSRPVSPDRPAPDVLIQMRIAAFCAGLGEIGWSKMFLTPQFGPRQRIAAVLTDMPLDPDPLYSGPALCDRCMLCAKGCSVGAIPTDKSVKVTVAGRELEWADIDYAKCSTGFCGGDRAHNPFMVSDAEEARFNEHPYGRAQGFKVYPQEGYGRALEGSKGCIRACMMHLEKQGKLSNKFKNPFQRRKPWSPMK
jgi:epoxyqueuosine reductase